jgi:glycine oxidase
VKNFDVIIVGGGIIGASLAFELAGRNVRVLIVDRQDPAREASWAAAGMLTPSPDTPESTELVPLAQKSLALYPDFIRDIEAASGMKTGWQRNGALEFFFGPEGPSERDEFAANFRRLGLSIESMEMPDARKMEPAISPAATAAVWFPEECSLDPRVLCKVVLAAASARGVEISAGIGVDRILIENGRCAGVAMKEETVRAARVVIAAGSFAGTVEGISRYCPTHPTRGQMIALESPDVVLTRVVRSVRGYIVPRGNGVFVSGSTIENVGFEKKVTAAGISKILAAVTELAPALAGAAIRETWSGLRPDTPDHLPIIGPTGIEGLWVASGHYRNGILLAAVTAKILGEWMTEGKSSPLIEPYSPLRFDAEPAPRAATR